MSTINQVQEAFEGLVYDVGELALAAEHDPLIAMRAEQVVEAFGPVLTAWRESMEPKLALLADEQARAN